MSVQVLLPGVLATLAGGAKHLDVDPQGETLADVLDALGAQHPMLARRIRDEAGQVRRFVNVFVDGDDVRYQDGLATKVRNGAEVHVLPSIAGGSSDSE
jgi:sulfur-carrier protein